MYNADTNSINRIRASDPSFDVFKQLADVSENAAAAKFIMRCESPYNHFVTFTREDTINLLSRRNESPALHEIIDGRRPFRLCFDIEQTLDIEYCADEFFAEYNAQRQADEDFEAVLSGRARVILPTVQPTPELFYAAKVMPARDEFARMIQTSLVDAVNIALDSIGAKYYTMQLDPQGRPMLVEQCDEQPITAATVMLFDSSAISPRVVNGKLEPPKLSFHVIFSTLFVASAHEGQIITEFVVRMLAAEPTTAAFSSAIDKSVIKNKFGFRIPGAAKSSEPMRILQAYGVSERTRAADFTHALLQQGIQNIDAAICVALDDQHAEPQRAIAAVTPEIIARIMARTPEYFAGYEFRSIEMNYVHFRRVGDSPACVFCKRVHTGDNAVFIVIKNARYYLKCRRMPRDQPHGIELFEVDPAPIAEIAPEQLVEHMRAMKIVTAETYPSRTVRIDREFIGDEILTQLDDQRKTILIRSPMGTGKTYALKSVIERLELTRQNIFMISFRRAFTLEKAAELGFDHYLNYVDAELPSEPARFICQYESLFRMHNDYIPSVLIIDEIESINEQIQSFQNNGGIALEALARFQNYVNCAEYVIVMDANLSCSSANYFLRERAADRPIIIVNEFKREREVTAYCFENALTEAIRERAATSRVGVCSDSRTYLQSLEKMLIADGIPAEEIKVVTSDNAQEFQREIVAAGNITELVKRYRVFGYNTTLLAGISIEDAELSEQYACFTENFITPTAAFQLIGRIRAMTRLGIYIAPQKTIPITFDQEIARTFCLKSCGFADMLRVGRKLSPLPRMLARHRVTMNNARARLFESILALWHDTGARIIFAAGQPTGASARKHFNEMRDKRAEKISAANSFEDDTFGKKLNDLIITYRLSGITGGTSANKLPVDLVKKMQKKANVSAWKTLLALNNAKTFAQLATNAAETLEQGQNANGAVAQITLESNDHARDIVKCSEIFTAFGVNMESNVLDSAPKTHDEYSALVKQLTGENDVKYAARKLNTLLEHTFGAKIASTSRTRAGYNNYRVMPIATSIFELNNDVWGLKFANDFYRAARAGAVVVPIAPVGDEEAENVARVDPLE